MFPVCEYMFKGQIIYTMKLIIVDLILSQKAYTQLITLT